MEKGLYLTQRTASGPRPFFNSQTRKAARSSLLVRKSVSTCGCTVVSSSSATMRPPCGAERRDFAFENSVFRSFEVVFLFTMAGIRWRKLELYVLPDRLGRMSARISFGQSPLDEVRKRPRPPCTSWTTGLSRGWPASSSRLPRMLISRKAPLRWGLTGYRPAARWGTNRQAPSPAVYGRASVS
jgi:hypothetical protein